MRGSRIDDPMSGHTIYFYSDSNMITLFEDFKNLERDFDSFHDKGLIDEAAADAIGQANIVEITVKNMRFSLCRKPNERLQNR